MGAPTHGTTARPDYGTPAHVGHIVTDLAQAMQRYSDELGLRWATPVEYGRPPHTSRFTSSIDGPTTIELIEAAPGTLWTAEHGSPVHHLAYWIDDLPGAIEDAIGCGMRVEAQGPTFAYLLASLGMRIELMDRCVAPAWTRWLDGGPLAVQPARTTDR